MVLAEIIAGAVVAWFLTFLFGAPIYTLFHGIRERSNSLIFVGVWLGIGAFSYIELTQYGSVEPLSIWFFVGGLATLIWLGVSNFSADPHKDIPVATVLNVNKWDGTIRRPVVVKCKNCGQKCRISKERTRKTTEARCPMCAAVVTV